MYFTTVTMTSITKTKHNYSFFITGIQLPRYTYTISTSSSAVGRWQKNIISRTPAMPATVRMIKRTVLDSAVMKVSSANRKYTIRLPNSKLTKTNILPKILTTLNIYKHRNVC